MNVVVALALALAAHSASQGTSRFVLDDIGDVDISVGITESDLPELCDVDFGVVDPAKKRMMQERLDVCVQTGMPQWLRLRVDNDACTLSPGSVRQGEGMAFTLLSSARCPAPAGRSFVIDWGLFAGAPFDHQSTATIVFPDETEHRVLLSKRHSKVRFDVAGGSHAGVVVGAIVAAIFVIAAGAFAVRRLKTTKKTTKQT